MLAKSIVSADFGTAHGLTNEDHESRELTEAEENVMRPINMVEKTASADNQSK